LRQSLQAKNTKSSRRRLRTIERRENRWMNDVNHQLSKTLVDRYGANTLFVVEDLTNVTFNFCSLKTESVSRLPFHHTILLSIG
ncbi:UNVERIFIED_CONTAM: hypothetical protein QML36_11050, partial [Aerococcus urinaeequi]